VAQGEVACALGPSPVTAGCNATQTAQRPGPAPKAANPPTIPPNDRKSPANDASLSLREFGHACFEVDLGFPVQLIAEPGRVRRDMPDVAQPEFTSHDGRRST
jgi:hypothetical protein